LAAGKFRKTSIRLAIKAHSREGTRNTVSNCPIRFGQLLDRRFARFRTAQDCECVSHSEKVGDRLLWGHLNCLVQQTNGAAHRYTAGERLELPGNDFEQCGLPDTVSSDDPCTLSTEAEVKIREDWSVVWGRPRKARQSDRRHS
jgi:hypothetical protein